MSNLVDFLSNPFIQEYIQTAKYVAASTIGAFLVQAAVRKIKPSQKMIVSAASLIITTGIAAHLRTVLGVNPRPYLIML